MARCAADFVEEKLTKSVKPVQSSGGVLHVFLSSYCFRYRTTAGKAGFPGSAGGPDCRRFLGVPT